jgi:surfactin synthase thioesterase subunit
MGGQIPAEVLADRDLAEHAYPMLRADLCLSQSLIDTTRELVVAADLHVVAGLDDTSLTDLHRWAGHTAGRCEVTRLTGGHLLSATNAAGVARLVEQALARH